jgi:hypothetical protein
LSGTCTRRNLGLQAHPFQVCHSILQSGIHSFYQNSFSLDAVVEQHSKLSL